MKKSMAIKNVRPIVQALFFIIFLSLMLLNKAQFWMGFIFLSIVSAAFFGRFYCGWACPINTLIRPVNWIKRKIGIYNNKDVPKILKSEKLRTVVFALFILGLAYTIYTIAQGRKFPLPLIIIPIGLVTTLFINEKAWHRYLCPWGVLFSLTSRFSKFGIKQNKCLSCSACQKSCPGDAIKVDKKGGAVIDRTNCLLCFECAITCPISSIDYKRESTK